MNLHPSWGRQIINIQCQPVVKCCEKNIADRVMGVAFYLGWWGKASLKKVTFEQRPERSVLLSFRKCKENRVAGWSE